MKCYGCGVEKDPQVLEMWTLDENLCTDEPIEPLFVLEVNGGRFGTATSTWGAAVVCFNCFHKLDPDMWISEGMWSSLNPKVPFDKLPKPIYCNQMVAGKEVHRMNSNVTCYPNLVDA